MADYIDSLERLAGLFQKGILSKEEFEAEKSRLLASHRGDERGCDAKAQTWSGRKKGIVIGAVTVTAILLALGVYTWNGTRAPEQKNSDRELALNNGKKREKEIRAQIAFDDLANCQPSGKFAELLSRVRSVASVYTDGAGQIQLSGEQNPQDVRVGTEEFLGNRIQLAELPLETLWLGLPVRSVRVLDWDEGSAISIGIAATQEKAARVIGKEIDSKIGLGKIVSNDRAAFTLAQYGSNALIFTCALIRNNDVEEKADGG